MIRFLTKTIYILAAALTVHACSEPQMADPDADRFVSEINAFKDWDEKNSFPEDAILFVGSSSIRMWKTATAFPGLPIINRGFGGAHISDVIHYYQHVIKKYNPALIVFYAGDNDVAGSKSVKQVFSDYKQIVKMIRKDNPDVKFVYVPIKPSSSRWEFWEDMAEVNKKIKEFNDDDAKLYYIDLASPMLRLNGKPNDNLFLEDQLHLNDIGYEIWNEKMAPLLDQLYSK